MADPTQPEPNNSSAPDVASATVDSCGPLDRPEQSRLYAACFTKPLAPRGLEWRYDELPHGPSVSVVARPPGGEAVSGYACNPRLAISRGDEATSAVVGQTGDVMTRPEWRKRGLFSGLDSAAMSLAKQRGWAFAFGCPNRRSAHIFVELGWRRIGTVRPWTFVLRADSFARDWRRRDGRVAATFVGFSARAGAEKRKQWKRELQRLSGVALTEFPEGVDALAASVERDFTFMLRRTKAWLDWRFLRAPSGLHRAFAVLRGDQLRAYCVVQLPRPAQPVGYLVDVLAADSAALRAAVELGFAELERSGASVVEATAIDGSWWSEELKDLGFGAPRKENFLTVIQQPLQPDHPLTRAAATASNWYFTDGDRDDETMG